MAHLHKSRRQFIKTVGISAVSLNIPTIIRCSQETKDRPNILWLTSEDNSPFFGCYGDPNADTPNFDQLASEGILYERAYANAPVCAPARSTIITGMYACSMGTHHMRSYNPLPEGIRFFTNYLREAGYYCTNNSKEDYNVAEKPEGCWDESSQEATYKNRQPGQPFFAVFNHTISHESSLHTIEPVVHDPAKMNLRAYHPDDPEIRRDYAQYYDKITELDRQIGEKLTELETDGLAEETIVFYYADHGGILTRSKRFLYDSGTHVPMIIRFPEKYRHLAPAKPGSRINRLVSFVDLAPTVLSLAGVPIPNHMQGHAFLGRNATRDPEYAYFFRGRMDERFDMMRAVTDGRYRYIRNYMPHLIYGQHLNYLWRMRTTQVWEEKYKRGECVGPQKYFWEEKSTEELYDTLSDPDEVNNLAEDPNYSEILDRMRKALKTWLVDIRDPGFLPEAEMIERSRNGSPFDMAKNRDSYDQARIMEAADMASQRDPANLTKLTALLEDEDSAVRYWGAIGCLALEEKARPAFGLLKNRLNDASPSVQIVATEILAKYDNPDQPLKILNELLYHPNEKIRLHAINVVDDLDEKARPILANIRDKMNDDLDYVRRVTEKALADLS
ncbi:sulfatase-like hydrolase/transferase [bacterium]|nr:sulfatase-like hydrolase/transferase [bacterium]RQV92035.1 MAG: sulfatase [bacterium]